MRTELTVLGVAILLLAGGGAAVALGYQPLHLGEESTGPAGAADAELASFETTGPFCADERPTNSSTIADGKQLVINDTIAVSAPDADLRADVDEIGPDRHVLALNRVPGEESADCELAIRYEATVNLSSASDYTLIETHDREFVGAYWADANAGGAYGAAGGGVEVGGDGPGRASDGNASASDGGAASAGDSAGGASGSDGSAASAAD